MPSEPAADATAESAKVVYAAIAANLGIAISKFVVATLTGSAAMLAEGVHSLVDTGNELLLLVGIRRSRRPADEWHPFGYGKVLYFWALIVALSVFSLGGGISIYHGIVSLRDPPPLEDPTWNYVVLFVAALFEGYSWNVSRRQLNRYRRPGQSIWQAVRGSKDASVFTVFVEDTAALAGIAIALLGIWLSHASGNPYFDPLASIGIGLVLVVAAVMLARETGGLLVGESMDRAQIASLRRIIAAEPAVETVGHLLTMQLGPEMVLLDMTLRFHPDLTRKEIAQAIDRLNRALRAADPAIQRIFLDSDSFASAVQVVDRGARKTQS